jgi:hypothetical protein
LRRHGYQSQKKRRYSVYPATWPWETEEPFSNIQSDVKHIYDKGSLGTTHTTHLSRHHLPRYQWTACDSRARLRFLAYSYSLDSTCGLAFLLLVLLWLRSFSVDCPVVFQTDWGVEFGGDNPRNVEEWNERFLTPLGGALKRYPKGRKGYNGRVERSHRTDDEEFYGPYLLLARNVEEFLALSTRWVYVYNVLRPHMGVGMGGKPPLTVLKDLGYNGNEAIALFPPIILDWISADLILSCDKEVGNNLLAHYKADMGCTHHLSGGARQCRAPPQGASHPCRQGRCGESPLRKPFFQPFPCPVKYVRFHRAGPARPQSTHVPSRESREKAWSQDFLEGHPHLASHRHPVNGCFLPERGGVEGTPSTNRNFEPFPCFLLA